MFPETCPFILFSNLLVYNCLHCSCIFFYSIICCYFSSFISCLFGSSLLLGKPGLRFVDFVCPLKKKKVYCYYFVLIYFYSFSDLYYFLPSVDFRFVCSSYSNSFWWQFRLFEIFLVSQGRPVLL